MEPSLLVYQVSSLTNHAFMTTHSCSTWMTGLKVWVSLKSLPMCIKSTTTMERCSYQSILTNRLLGTSRPHQWPTTNVASVLLAYFLLMALFLGRCSTPLLQLWHPSWRRHRGIPAPTIVLLSCPNCRPCLQRQAMFWKGIPTAIFCSSHPPQLAVCMLTMPQYPTATAAFVSPRLMAVHNWPASRPNDCCFVTGAHYCSRYLGYLRDKMSAGVSKLGKPPHDSTCPRRNGTTWKPC